MTLETPYYIGHFLGVLKDIQRQYGPILSQAERRHIDVLRALPLTALCLYVRLANRKGPYFRADKLKYSECQPLDTAIQALCDIDLLQPIELLSYEPERLLGLFTQVELRSFFKNLNFPRSATKAELTVWLLDRDGAIGQLASQHTVVSLNAGDPWPFLKFLYFGELTDNLSGFVVQELGHIVTQKPPEPLLSPLFKSRKAADDCYKMACLYAEFRNARVATSALELNHSWQSHGIERNTLSPNAWGIHDRYVAKLGYILEREGYSQEAKALYEECPAAPCRERLAKLLIKEGKKEAAIAYCQSILSAPSHNDEEYAMRQILGRLNGKRSSQTRQTLHQAIKIEVEHNGRTVEAATLEHYQKQGWQGIHSENWVWNAFLGLLLWDIIYDPAYGTFHNTLQMAPADLYQPAFYTARSIAIEDQLVLLNNKAACMEWIRATAKEKDGITNPFIGWHADLLPIMEVFLHHIPSQGLIAALRHMTQDVKRRCKGFPDLFLWKEDEYRFYEVKSLNDQLSSQQYQWLKFLQENGIEAQPLRVVRSEPLLRVA